MNILKLIPTIQTYVWGGKKLKNEYFKGTNENTIAETWELSCHPDGTSIISSGQYKGVSLYKYISTHGKEILGTSCNKFEDFPILVKLIDAKEKLSIQVHPNDEYALKNEKQYGKSEMWYVIDAKEDSFIYYGFKNEISKEELKKRIENNTLLDVLNKINVKKGNVFFIEPGTVHAIGNDILIAEIQQSSNITYRIYDYGRLGLDEKPRELHIQKGLDVIKREKPKLNYNFGKYLVKCKYFQVEKIEINNSFKNYANLDSFHSILFIEGEGKISTEEDSLSYKKGDSFFIGAGSGKYRIEGTGYFLLTTIPKN